MVDSLALPGIPKKPGRPSTGKAKTGAQRMADYRARRNELMRQRLEDLLVQVYRMGLAGNIPAEYMPLRVIFRDELRALKVFPRSVLDESAD